jgi:lysophospholipase L1-like esterase
MKRAFVSLLGLSLLTGVVACTRKDTPAADSPTGPSLISNAAAATGSNGIAAPTSTAPRFVGRWVPEPGGGPGMRCAWSGSYVVGRFKGTGISVKIKDEGFNLFQVIIDGEIKKVLKTDKAKGEALYVLADNLSDGQHDVSIHRRTEAKVGEAVVYGFEPSGRLLPTPPPPERRMETIGDSISTGFGNEGPGAACGYVNSEQNEYLTYGAIAARNLNADHTTIAWSGKTLHEMKEYFDKALPAREGANSPKWDFAQYQPQVVVVNVGTNNFALVDPGEARFVRLYHELVAAVRTAYPKAFLVLALGSMLTNIYPEGHNNLTQARKYMKVAVQKLKDAGDTNLEFLEFPEQNHADGLGCGFHPSLKTHKLMSDRLTAFIKEHMGW